MEEGEWSMDGEKEVGVWCETKIKETYKSLCQMLSQIFYWTRWQNVYDFHFDHSGAWALEREREREKVMASHSPLARKIRSNKIRVSGYI